MQKFAGWSGGKLQRKTGWLKCGLLLALTGLLVSAGRAQTNTPANDNFANAEVISGTSGTTNVDNVGATTEPGETSSIVTDDNSFGVSVGASVWYSWTAPANGNVTFNTITTNGPGFETVLATYTGNSVANLTLLGANFQAAGATNGSETSFYALAGTTYFIGVYGFNQPPFAEGTTVLNWSQTTPGFSAGEFRFTSTSYTDSDFESFPLWGPSPPMSATPGARVSVTRVGGAVGKVNVHYTVTNSLALVNYGSEEDEVVLFTDTVNTNNVLLNSDTYTLVNYVEWIYDQFYPTNYLTAQLFDLPGFYEETETIVTSSGATPPYTYSTNVVTLLNDPYPAYYPGGLLAIYTNLPTSTFTNYDSTGTNIVSLTNVGTNVYSTGVVIITNYVPGALAQNPKDLSQPWDYLPASGTLTFNDYEMTKDIYVTVSTNNLLGDYVSSPAQIVVTLDSAALDTNEVQSIPAPTLDPARSTTTVNSLNFWQYGEYVNGNWNGSLYPGIPSLLVTNLINFGRSTVRVNRTAGTATISITRRTTDPTRAGCTMYYSIDYGNANANNNKFTLQSGSDYAIPDNALKTVPEGVVDFTNSTVGSITWVDNDITDIKYITVPIVNNNRTEFNKDFLVQFYSDNGHKWQNELPGNVQTCTVTILNGTEPAGAVDVTYNPESKGLPNPGVNGQDVYAVLVDTNGNALIGGQFSAYDATNCYNVVRALPNGQVDQAFVKKTGNGAQGGVDHDGEIFEASVNALALDASGNIYVGGLFSSFNSSSRNSIARLNPDGSLDNSGFLPHNGIQTLFDDDTVAQGIVQSILIQPNGQILVAGNFTSYNNTNRNCIVRLNPDGSVDPTFNPGVGPAEDNTQEPFIYSLALETNGAIVIGGDFTKVDGTSFNGVARLNPDGSLDTGFKPGIGAQNGMVNAVAVDANGLILVGGDFTQFGALGTSAGITRLNPDGSIDTTFGVGSGVNGGVNCLSVGSDGTILVGGPFVSVNQTRRIGIARLLPDGTLDTSFMDTAYNQFAGLINPYYNPDINSVNPVYAMAMQADENIMIGGSFYEVGGGLTRSEQHPRSNVARLIGGATAGPGNIQLAQTSYSADPSAGTTTNSTVLIGVNRINGTLGPASATLAPVTLPVGPGAAVYGQDFLYSATPINYGTTWAGTWMLSDGNSGGNGGTPVTVYNNSNPNATLDLQLTAPVGQDIFFLGGNNKATSVGLFNAKYTEQDGENIPLGVALGQSLSPLTIIHNQTFPGVLNFSSTTYVTNQTAVAAIINVVRTGGSEGAVTVNFKIIPGTAVAGIDYTVPASTQLKFPNNINSAVITIPLKNSAQAHPDRFLGIQLYTPGGGATVGGGTNAVLQIIDAYNSYGTVSFSGGVPVENVTSTSTNIVTTYGTNENTGPVMLTVSRQGGSLGVLGVTVASRGGTAVNGVNYGGFTNVVTWNNGISGPTNLYLPVMRDGVYTPNLTVNLWLSNPTWNGSGVALTNVAGVSTNASVTISNVDFPGSIEFSAPSYSFNENGGEAIIPVIRTGGTAGTVSAQFTTVDGSAVAGTQYMATNGLLVFTNGQVGENFRVPIIDNGVQDINRILNLVLSTNASLPSALGSPSTATLTIINNETYVYPPGQINSSYSSSGFNGPVYGLALEPTDDKLLVAGSFTAADGVARNNLARMNPDGSLDQYFSSATAGQGANDIVRSVIVQSNGCVVIGGYFTSYNGFNFNHIARLVYNGGLDSTFNPGSGPDNPIYALAQSFINGASVLYAGGAFTTFSGNSRNGIVRLQNSGTVDTTFNPGTGVSGTVYALAVQSDGRVVIGGQFTNVNGIALNNIARLNVDGSVDLTFTNAQTNPAIGANNVVNTLAIQQDGRILIGGLFTNVNGVAFNHLARLNANGTVDPGFIPGIGADDDVLTISLQSDTRIVVGGDFTKCSGVTRHRITRLNPDGTVDPTINFGTGFDSFVAASVIEPDGNLDLGGGFQTYDGTPEAGLVQVYGGSAAGSGQLEFTSAGYQVNQTNGVAVITVQRLGGTSGTNADGTGDIYVNFQTSDGTATNGINYVGTNATLDFPAGEVQVMVAVPVINVAGINPPLTVNMTLMNPTPPATIPGQYDAQLTIIDPQSAVSLTRSQYSVAKNYVGGVGIITLTRQGNTNGSCSVDFTTTLGGTALVGTDYTPVEGTITFNPGDSVQSFEIPINNNNIPEGNQTVTFALANPQGTLLYSPTNGTLTIIDTTPAPGQFAFSAANYAITNGGGVGISDLLITVVRTNGSSGDVSLYFATEDGTATNGLKYISTNGFLSFPDTRTSASFVVQILNTPTAEGPEYFNLGLFNPSSGSLGSPSNATVTIFNTNTGIAFASGNTAFTEHFGTQPGTVTVGVVRFNNTDGTTTVNYSTTNGTAVAGTNFVGITNATLTFLPGISSTNITITTLYDPLVTGDLSFTVGLAGPVGAQLTSPYTATLTDHDVNTGLSFLTSSNSVYRNAGYLPIVVVCSNTNQEPVSVNYFTVNGTAASGVDYTATAGTLGFTNGQIFNYFYVPIISHTSVESNKTFNVVLSNPTGTGVLEDPSNELVTIVNTNTPYGLSFSTPVVISGSWVSTNINNTQGLPEPNDPTIAGNAPTAPVWFQWTAPADGEVTVDTIGSMGVSASDEFGLATVTNNLQLDTVLGVYTGASLGSLNQIAVNDDMYPQPFPQTESYLGQYNYGAQNVFNTNTYPNATNNNNFQQNQPVQLIETEYFQPFSGPSELRFNAKAGVTYYIAADTKQMTYQFTYYPNQNDTVIYNARGVISLNLAYHPAGVFRFATESVDMTGLYGTNGNPLLLYQCAETESDEDNETYGTYPVVDYKTTHGTYYYHDTKGLLVTVTRVAGSTGRVSVDYATEDGNPSVITNGDNPAVAGVDYTQVRGTLIFDDFEMSKTILIPIIDNTPNPEPNRDFTVVLSNPLRDSQESSEVSLPRVDSIFGTVLCRILDCNVDPKGPSTSQVISTNTTVLAGITNSTLSTNILISLIPTNAIFNFSKSNYRVPRDESAYFGRNYNTTNVPIAVFVNRFGTNQASITLHWRLDNYFLAKNSTEDSDNLFPLQAGSDYANPPNNVANGVAIYDNLADFAGVGGESGTITFPAKTNPQDQVQSQEIKFSVANNYLTEFNRDVHISLYDTDAKGNPIQDGMNEQATVTILFNDEVPPAGSVDEFYNPDLAADLQLATNNPSLSTSVVSPGTELYSEVYSLAVLPANVGTAGNQSLIAGAFSTYTDGNNTHTVNGIARLNYDGSLDATFTSGSGVNVFPGGEFITVAQLTTNNQILIGGDFNAYNGFQRNSIARLDYNGLLDTTFNPGSGFNGTVWAMAQQADGRVVIGGDFTTYNNNPAHYVARINTDGSLDTTFNAGTNLNGAVYAVAVESDNNAIVLGGAFKAVGGAHGQNYIVRVNPDGSLDTTFNTVTGPNGAVRTLAIQPDDRVLAGGVFTLVAGQSDQHIVRFNPDGTLDSSFNAGAGADGTIYSINYNVSYTNYSIVVTNVLGGTNLVSTNTITLAATNSIYVGGSFTTFNGTHRLGFARLYTDGTVDTTFLDTAYNQFAGLPRALYKDSPGTVYASGVQDDGNILIVGAFQQVGGGQADKNVRNYLEEERGLFGSFEDSNLAIVQDLQNGNILEPKSRDGVRYRGNVARLIGGVTPGPGNIGMASSSYVVNKTQPIEPVSLVRTNGNLGYASANFSVISGLAQSGSDFSYASISPIYPIGWEYKGETRDHYDGLYGPDSQMNDKFGNLWTFGIHGPASVNINIINDASSAGNLTAQLQLANPIGADQFYLGGQNIPVGVALGVSAAPLILVDNSHQDGVFGFASPAYTASSSPVNVGITRNDGISAGVTVYYQTVTNGSTALPGTDYIGTNGSVFFGPGVVSNSFPVSIYSTSSKSPVEKSVDLQLYKIQDASLGNASLGLTNAILRIINPNFLGYLNLTTNYYSTNLSGGAIAFTVSRTVGSLGTLKVQYATADGTASNQVNYIGTNSFLKWDSGDVSPRTMFIPLINGNQVGSALQFSVSIFNPSVNGTNVNGTALVNPLGATTNATLNINNNNSYGTFQFSSAQYLVNENGGSATVTVTRTGSAIGAATLVVATADGTALANANYQPVSNVLTFAAGQVSRSFNVPILPQDTSVLPPSGFFFNVALTNPNPAPGASLGTPAKATVNIVANAAYNQPPGGPDTSFDPSLDFNGSVLDLALQSNGKMIAAGLFTSVDGANLNHVARINSDGSLDASFLLGQSGASGNVNSVVSQTDDRVLIGGSFTNVDGTTEHNVARLMTDGSLDTSFAPDSGADSAVYALAETFINGSRNLYVGGAFITFNGLSFPGVVRLDNYGDVDSTFATGLGAEGTVYAMAAYPTNAVYDNGDILVGGSFTNFNNVAVGNLVRLTQNGSVDPSFNAFLGNGTVRAVTLQSDGYILVGGAFSFTNGGVAVHNLARLNPDGSLDGAFATNLLGGVNGTVDAIAIQPDNGIVVAGQFTQANGLNRNNLTRLLSTGAVDTAINFGDGANGAIDALLIQPTNNFIVIGGAFTELEDQPLQYLARLYGGSVTGDGQFTFSTANYQVDETNGVATITVVRTGGSSGTNVQVTFATADGTATSGVNYLSVNTNLVFVAGQEFQTVTVPVLDNGQVYDNPTVNLLLANATGGAGLGNQATAQLTIINDNSGVSFAAANYSVPKNTVVGVANIGIVRVGSTSGSCSVYFSTATNGTALAGTDYYPTNGIVAFAPGVAQATVQVPIINNTIPEGQRTVALILTNAVSTALTSPTNATLTIIDTVNAPGVLYFATNSYTVLKEGGTDAYLTVLRTNGSSGEVSVYYNTVAGTASPGFNYVTSSGTLTLEDGVSSGQISIPLLDNSLVQGTVNFTVNLSDAQGGATLTPPTNAVVNILDHNYGVAFQNATNYTIENDNSATVVVQRIGATGTEFHVSYVTTPGTALPGTNYSSETNTLDFAADQSLKSINIPVFYNTNQNGDLFFNVSLFNPTAGAALVAPTNTVVVIHDSNAGLSFTNAATSVLENAGSITLFVVCANPSIEPVPVAGNTNIVPLTVQYFTTNGSATAGIDYTPVSGTLIFTNNNGTNWFTVPIILGSQITTNRSFGVVLANPTSPGVIFPPSTETVTIINVNSGVEFSAPSYSVLKTGPVATINVNRTGYTNSLVQVNFSTTNGTAVAGVNFVSTNGTLIFTNGITTNSFAVPVIDSTVLQPDLTVYLQLSGVVNAALTYPSFATLSILDMSGSYVVPAGAVILSQSPVNAYPGVIYPGQTNTLAFAFRDESGTDVTNLLATLLPSANIVSPSGSQHYGYLTGGGHSVSRPFTFTASGTNGQLITATFKLQDVNSNTVPPTTNTVGVSGLDNFTFYLGTWTASYSNTAPIVINAMDGTTSLPAKASPDPSEIIVSNLPGVILKTTVTLTNLTHGLPSAIQALVVAPNQLDTVLMAHVGGSHGVNGVTLTFDDAAATNLTTGQIVTSTNRPTSATQPTFR